MKLFLSFVLATLISMMLIPILIKWAKQLNMLDEPDERKVHTKAIPRCGGLGLAVATLLTILVILPFSEPFISLLIGGAIIVLFGVLDDMYDLNYKWKFVGQFVAVIYVIYEGTYLRYLPFSGLNEAPIVLSYLITFLFVVGVTNAVNLSDGLDGLAAGIMLMTLAAITFFSAAVGGNNLAALAIALSGGIFGFLRFNTHPAVVFMGDTGSQFIGFITAFLCIYLVQDVHQTLNPALPLLLLGLPVLDTLTVMIMRIASGKSPFSPDKRHIHHRLLIIGFTHAETVGAIYVLQAVFLFVAFQIRYNSDILVLGTYGLICFSILAALYFAQKRNWQVRGDNDQAERRRSFFRRNNWIYKGARLYIEYATNLFLLFVACSMLASVKSVSETEAVIYICFITVISFLDKSILNELSKLCIYIIAIYSGFELTLERFNGFPIDVAVNTYLVILFFVVFLAIRVTRRTIFSLSTQDVLITFFAFAIIFFSESKLPVDILLRLLCLGYASEYLFNFDRNYRILKFLALLSGVLILSGTLSKHIVF